MVCRRCLIRAAYKQPDFPWPRPSVFTSALAGCERDNAWFANHYLFLVWYVACRHKKRKWARQEHRHKTTTDYWSCSLRPCRLLDIAATLTCVFPLCRFCFIDVDNFLAITIKSNQYLRTVKLQAASLQCWLFQQAIFLFCQMKKALLENWNEGNVRPSLMSLSFYPDKRCDRFAVEPTHNCRATNSILIWLEIVVERDSIRSTAVQSYLFKIKTIMLCVIQRKGGPLAITPACVSVPS